MHQVKDWEFGVPGIFDNVRDGLVLVRFPEREVVLFNRAASHIFGIPTSKGVGMQMDDLFKDPAVLRQALETSQEPVGEWPGHGQSPMHTHIKGDMDLTDVEVQFCRVEQPLEGGPLVLLVVRPGAVSELAALAKKGDKAQRRVDELEERARQLALFFSEAAHEFNTPLTVVLLQSKLLHAALGPLAPKQEKALARIDTNVHRLVLLSQDLLDLARADAGHLLVKPTEVDLADLMVREGRNFQDLAKQQGITLHVEPAPATVFVKGEAIRLRQVLANLLGNALKFTPTGGHVDVRLEARDGTTNLVVRDDGRGMEAKDLERLFQPFVRIESPDQPKKPGSGLGLYLSKRIIEAHGGQVGAASPGLGKGMEFRFGVPISVPAEEAPSSEGDKTGRTRMRPQGGPARTHGRQMPKAPDPINAAAAGQQGGTAPDATMNA